jgi:hypothetical protein
MKGYFGAVIRSNMRNAEKNLRTEKLRLGIRFLFHCEVIDWIEDEMAYKVRFSYGKEILAEEVIPRRYLDQIDSGSTFLENLLRKIEMKARQRRDQREKDETA